MMDGSEQQKRAKRFTPQSVSSKKLQERVLSLTDVMSSDSTRKKTTIDHVTPAEGSGLKR